MLAAAAVVLIAWRGPKVAGQEIGGAVVDMADGVVSGVAFGVGERIGLPDTRKPEVVSQGAAELAAGDYWNASFHLPAGDFISGVWNKLTN